MNLYQSNTYRKDFKASYISVMNQGFKRGSKWRIHSPENSFSQLIQQFQVVTRGTRPGVITVFHTQPYGRFIEIPSSLRRKKHTANQFFLGGSFTNRDQAYSSNLLQVVIARIHLPIFKIFSNLYIFAQIIKYFALFLKNCTHALLCRTGPRDNVRTSIEFRRESQPQHLTRWFFLKNKAIHFHIIITSIIRPVKQNQLSFASVHSFSQIRLHIQKPILSSCYRRLDA